MRSRLMALFAVVVLLGAALYLPRLRRALIRAVTQDDATPSEPAPLPGPTGKGLAPVARTRVILIDGLSEAVADTLPELTAACAKGLHLRVDVGFPTVSLPVETELWSGLTQQQSGIVTNTPRAGLPTGVPHAVPGSIAIAEDHGYIVRSLGFATALPLAGATALDDQDPVLWREQWQARAHDAVASPARLAFIHILRVDNAGHHHGGASPEYVAAAKQADVMVAQLMAAAPDARWFLLSDHGHVGAGGHGGMERAIRQVSACVIDPAESLARPGPRPLVHIVDLARAIADSVNSHLDQRSRGRPLDGAVATPLEPDQAIPRLPITSSGLAVAILAVGLALTVWCLARVWLAPLWFLLACASLIYFRGEPTLSLRYVYQGSGFTAAVTWLPLLALAAATTYAALGKTTLPRVLGAQLALPIAATLAALVACGALPTIFGAAIAPVVPRYTAYSSPLLLMTAHGCAAVALGVLARRVLRSSDRSAPPAPPRSEPSAAP